MKLPSPELIIGNRRIGAEARFPVHDPYSGDLVCEVDAASPVQIDEALEGARDAHPDCGPEERASILERAARVYEQNRDAEAWLITRETGLCVRQTRYEIGRAVAGLRYAAHQARILPDSDLAAPYAFPGEEPRAALQVVAEPVDLAVAITPFNHPLNQVVHKIAPAIAAGACVVLKPSEKTPLSALRLGEILIECGLPEHMLNVVNGWPAEAVVRQLVTHPDVELVSFTGSVAVGKAIARTIAAGGNPLARYIPELGGNSAFVVMDDADPSLSAEVALSAFDNSGQRCTSIKRILAHERIADAFVDALVARAEKRVCGDPYDERTEMGTVIDEEAAKQIEGRVERAIADGATLRLGNQRSRALYPPTVLDSVSPESELVREETFGPVAPVIRVSSLDECISIVRAGRFRLAGGIATASEETARRYSEAIRVGQFSWNGPPSYRTENAPFGGFGDSGNGAKEGIVHATHGMLNLRTFYTHPTDSG